MPGASGLEAIRNIRMRHSASRILVFSMHSEAALVKAAFSAGAFFFFFFFFRRVLEHQGDFRVVAEADNAVDAYRAFKTHAPDVVVMDISMPGASGLEAILTSIGTPRPILSSACTAKQRW